MTSFEFLFFLCSFDLFLLFVIFAVVFVVSLVLIVIVIANGTAADENILNIKKYYNNDDKNEILGERYSNNSYQWYD